MVAQPQVPGLDLGTVKKLRAQFVPEEEKVQENVYLVKKRIVIKRVKKKKKKKKKKKHVSLDEADEADDANEETELV